MSAAVHPRLGPRRGAARASRWWGKAWVRAVEESAYAEGDLRAGRTLARSGHVGQVTTDEGGFVAAVEDEDGLWTVSGSVPVLDPAAAEALVETVAAESGRVVALLAGDLPHTLVEHAEESGVELLPYGGELATECTCDAWVDPCVHALAVLYQLTWLLEADPFVLLQLRGLPRDRLLARLHRRLQASTAPESTTDEGSLETGLDAALRAERILAVLDDPDASLDHLF
jgi:uncharacterized Zn finger protein